LPVGCAVARHLAHLQVFGIQHPSSTNVVDSCASRQRTLGAPTLPPDGRAVDQVAAAAASAH
jgi:hypothetical protein